MPSIGQQRRFEIALLGAIGELHEVKNHRISGDPLHRLNVSCIQRSLEVGDRCALALVKTTRDGCLKLRT